MKFNQTRLIIYLIIAVNIATTKLSVAVPIDTLQDGCSFSGTIVMPATDFCGPYILLDNGLKIRPYDTILTEKNYRVRVGFEVVDSSCGNALSVHLTCLQVLEDTNCHASFSFERLRCNSDSNIYRCPDNTYRFINGSNSDLDSIIWNFDDGNLSSELNPTHSFPNEGIYNICLTIFGKSGCQATYCQTLIIGDSTVACKAEIEYISGDSIPILMNASDSHNMIVFPGFPALFRDVSKHTVIERLWDFGDGAYANDENVTHFYRKPGVYNVCLTITTAEGCTDRQCIEIMVGIPDPCIADFTYEMAYPDCITDYIAYQFQPYTADNVIKYRWAFCDSTFSEEQSPTHFYKASGDYTVCLTVTYDNSCEATECKSIVIPEIQVDSMKSKCGQVSLDQHSLTDVISVYPNPAHHTVTIVLNNYSMQNVDITLIDVLGQVRKHYGNMELTSGENLLELDIQTLPAGNYFYIVSSPETTLRGSISVVK